MADPVCLHFLVRRAREHTMGVLHFYKCDHVNLSVQRRENTTHSVLLFDVLGIFSVDLRTEFRRFLLKDRVLEYKGYKIRSLGPPPTRKYQHIL